MNDQQVILPLHYEQILAESDSLGFSMKSDLLTGSLLRTLAATRPGGKFLEIGTGTGLSLAFMLDGMDANSTVTSIDNAEDFQAVARTFFANDERVSFYTGDGNDWIHENLEAQYDLIFADAWPGKYMLLEETLALLRPGGIYLVDDMNPQPNWPEGHAEKAATLSAFLVNIPGYETT